MENYLNFFDKIENFITSKEITLTENIDDYNINIEHMNNGIFIYSKLPINSQDSEQMINRYMQCSLLAFSDFNASLSINQENDQFYLSSFHLYPINTHQLLNEIESLSNLLDIFGAMMQNQHHHHNVPLSMGKLEGIINV